MRPSTMVRNDCKTVQALLRLVRLAAEEPLRPRECGLPRLGAADLRTAGSHGEPRLRTALEARRSARDGGDPAGILGNKTQTHHAAVGVAGGVDPVLVDRGEFRQVLEDGLYEPDIVDSEVPGTTAAMSHVPGVQPQKASPLRVNEKKSLSLGDLDQLVGIPELSGISPAAMKGEYDWKRPLLDSGFGYKQQVGPAAKSLLHGSVILAGRRRYLPVAAARAQGDQKQQQAEYR